MIKNLQLKININQIVSHEATHLQRIELLKQILFEDMTDEERAKVLKEIIEDYLKPKKELEQRPLHIGDVVSIADYNHVCKLMDQLNTIMWESYMIKGKDFGRQEGYKIMGLLEQWAERH